MQSSMIKSITEDFGNGGTIDGDLTISGDLQVSGGGSLSFDEIIQGTQVIDVTNTEALLVRKNDDGGDVFVVDTTNSRVGIGTASPTMSLEISNTSFGDQLRLHRSSVASGGFLTLSANDSAGNMHDYAKLGTVVESSTNASEDGALVFQTSLNGTLTEYLRITSTGNVGIGTDSPAFDVEIADNGTNSQATMAVTGYNDQTGYRPEIQLRKSNSDTLGSVSATPTGTQLGMIRFRGVDSGNGFDDGATITATQNGGANTKVPTDLKFETSADTSTNSNQLVLHHDGGIGIGTASPEEKIHSTGAIVSTGVNDTGATAGTERAFIDLVSNKARIGHFRGTTSAGSGGLQLYTDSVERMSIDASGNIGIGRTPTQKLDIYASSGNQTIMNELGGAGNAELRLKNNAGDRIIRASSDKLQFIDNADSRVDLTIDGSGNVGIGLSTNIDKKLHILSSTSGDGITLEQSSTGSNAIRFEANSSALRGLFGSEDSDGGAILSGSSGYSMVLRSESDIFLATNGNNEALKIDTSQKATFAGDVSISTSANYGTLTVGGSGEVLSLRSSSGASELHFYEGGTTRGVISSLNGSDGLSLKSGTTERMRIDSSGNVTVNSGSAIQFGDSSYRIIGSTVGNYLRFYTESTQALSIDDSQDATFAGDVTISKSGNAFLNLTSTGGGARIKLTGQANETTNGLLFYEASNQRGQINYNHSDQKMEFKTGDSTTLALTLDSTQDATFANTAIFANNKSINFLNTSGAEKAIISFDSSNITKIGDASNSGTLQLNSGNATFAGSVGVGASPVSSFPAQNVTIEGATAGLVLRDSTGSNQATQFFTLYSSNGDIIGMFDDSKSLKFGHADDAVGTNYTDVLTLGSDNSATFAGNISAQDISAYNQITIESADISSGENNGLKLVNTSGTEHVWHITNGQTGVSNDNFTIRDSTNNRDVLVLTSSGNATFYNKIIIGSGIEFPASQSASSDANTLDDYEEGTWTPVISDGGTSFSCSTATGSYTKIGNQVFIQVTIVTSEDGSGSSLQISLPFNYNASGSNFITSSVRTGGIDLDANAVQVMLGNSSSGTSNLLYFTQIRDNFSELTLPATAMSSGDTIRFNAHYKVA